MTNFDNCHVPITELRPGTSFRDVDGNIMVWVRKYKDQDNVIVAVSPHTGIEDMYAACALVQWPLDV